MLYHRSISKHNLYYDPFIGDGDSLAYRSGCNENVHGPTKSIQKKECINYMAKRMGTGLRTIIRGRKSINLCYVCLFRIFLLVFICSK